MSRLAFEAALTNTDAVIQPRQSNTWGALSLDHVYEFMGGINLAIHDVTGKNPDAYLSDYRNRNNTRMQELKEAIGIESRTTILNPSFIKAKMKGGAGAASEFSEILKNTYGWNVMKPEVIDDKLWDNIYNVYINDCFNLGIQEFLESKSPASLESMTTTMLETIRKGMWNASESQVNNLIRLHSELVDKYKLSSTAVLSNGRLKAFVSDRISPDAIQNYHKNLASVTEVAEADKGIVMKKEVLQKKEDGAEESAINSITVILITVGIACLLLMIVYARHRKMQI